MRMRRLRFYMAGGALMATILAGQASSLPADVFEDVPDRAAEEMVVHHVFDADPEGTDGFMKGRVVSVKDSLVCIRSGRKGSAHECEHVIDLTQGRLQGDRMPEAGDSIEVFGRVADVLLA